MVLMYTADANKPVRIPCLRTKLLDVPPEGCKKNDFFPPYFSKLKEPVKELAAKVTADFIKQSDVFHKKGSGDVSVSGIGLNIKANEKVPHALKGLAVEKNPGYVLKPLKLHVPLFVKHVPVEDDFGSWVLCWKKIEEGHFTVSIHLSWRPGYWEESPWEEDREVILWEEIEELRFYVDVVYSEDANPEEPSICETSALYSCEDGGSFRIESDLESQGTGFADKPRIIERHDLPATGTGSFCIPGKGSFEGTGSWTINASGSSDIEYRWYPDAKGRIYGADGSINIIA